MGSRGNASVGVWEGEGFIFFLPQCIQSNFDNLIIPRTMELGRIMSYLSFAWHVYGENSDCVNLITNGKPYNC